MNGKRKTLSNHAKLNELRPLTVDEVCAAEKCSPPLLSIGNRIVWLSDNGPEFGYIKWLGKLPDVGNDWMAGVHFDNPVGSGTGVYQVYQLFEAPINHASLVPVIGLLKAEDFLGTIDESRSSPRESKPPPSLPPPPIPTMESGHRCNHVLTTSTTNAGASSPNVKYTEISPLKPSQRIKHRTVACDSDKLNHFSSPLLNIMDLDYIDSSRPPQNANRERVIYHKILCEPDSAPLPRVSNKPTSETSGDFKPHIDSSDFRPLFSSTIPSTRTSSSPSSEKICSHINSVNPRKPLTNHQITPTLQPLISYEPQLPALSGVDINNKLHRDIEKLDRSSKLVTNGVHENELDIGSLVEITIDDIPKYGVIKWIGHIPGHVESDLVAGVELEEEHQFANNGSYNGVKYFDCALRRGYFILLNQCRRDTRFQQLFDRKPSTSAGSDSSRVTCDIPPLSTLDDLKCLSGKRRGIQGHHNSCYLDATLFAMFSWTTIFESLLHRPQGHRDIPEYQEVQRVLKEEIVNPLRANLYVSGDRVMHLRTLLEKLTSVRGLTSEEKDPEEFLNLLLNEVLKAEPYLKLSSGLESYFYQLFVEKDEKLIMPTVQQLFDQSFLASDFKLREIPPCLLIQMPRFGRQFKMYSRIIPSLYLDITDVLDNSPRQCSVCGQLAEYECKECFGQFGEGLDSTAFCQKCLDKSHGHKKRSKHKAVRLSIPTEFSTCMLKEHAQIQRIYMELFAVLCIETSHYVCFVKCGSGPDAPWCFFDSMADRNGEQDGYNIPEVVPFPNLRWWLSDEGNALLLSTKDDKMLPEMSRRLLCDAYMCMYQSPDLAPYR